MSANATTCPRCVRELPAGARYCPTCGTRVGSVPRLLRRRRENQQLAGVCSGLAEYFDQDPVFVRACYAVATFFTGVLPGIVLYVILALILPSD
jgi:phage shock protein PspC (stress-responsive transcriptional regulator)